jgi:hypothetical protein
MNDNDSSGVQSDVWGARAQDWAEIEDGVLVRSFK